MRRSGKCVGKKLFAYRTDAEAQVIKNFIFKAPAFGIYECPTCLDFHTTSKYDNRSNELRSKCKFMRSRYWAKVNVAGYERALLWLNRELYKNATPIQVPTPVKIRPIQDLIKNAYNLMYKHLGIKKPKTTLKGTLPIALQREILHSLTTSQTCGKV